MSVTAGDNPLKSSMSHPGPRGGGSQGLGMGAKLCPIPEKGGPSTEEFAREGLSSGA